LAEQAALQVKSVRLVNQVRGFGNVAGFDTNVFRPGQWVIVYCEVDNFVSRPQDDGQFKTQLSQRVEVLSSEGQSRLQQDDPKIEDVSMNYRRDFFLARRLQLPATLGPASTC